MLSLAKRLHDNLTRLGFMLGGAALATVTGAYVYQVFVRYFLKSPSSWANDLVSYLLVVMVALALPRVTRDNGHVAVTFLSEKLSARHAFLLHRCTALLAALSCIVTAAFVLNENIYQYTHSVYTMGNHPIPKWWLSGCITWGLFSSGIYFFRSAFENFVNEDAREEQNREIN